MGKMFLLCRHVEPGASAAVYQRGDFHICAGCTHACRHTHTNTHKHTHTHTHTDAHIHTQTCTSTRTQTHIHKSESSPPSPASHFLHLSAVLNLTAEKV